MSGIMMNVVPPTFFYFSGYQASQTGLVTVATRIDLSGFESGMLQVRLHSANVAQADSVTVGIYADGYTPDDPGTQWDGIQPLSAIASVQFTGPSPTLPDYKTNAFVAPFSNLARVLVICTKSA